MLAKVSMKRLAERVRTLRGWRKRGAAFAAGAASVFAMPPCFAWPVLWVTLPVLVWLIDGASLNGEAAAPPSLIPSPRVRSHPQPPAGAGPRAGGRPGGPWAPGLVRAPPLNRRRGNGLGVRVRLLRAGPLLGG